MGYPVVTIIGRLTSPRFYYLCHGVFLMRRFLSLGCSVNSEIENKKILVALTGNPNSGKTTVFNALAGTRHHVANYPGVTVEKKEGHCRHQGYSIHLVDLPGTY